MFDVVLTNNWTIDIARYAANLAASEMFGRDNITIAVAVDAAIERVSEFAEIRELITPERVDKRRYWVWKCKECGGWHATIGLPDGECFGPTAEALEEAGNALVRARRLKRLVMRWCAWGEAEFAAKLLGLDTCPSDAESWPDLGVLWKRLEKLEAHV